MKISPEAISPVSILGVDYRHLTTGDEGDLYVTEFGRPFLQQLLPRNWYARDWFESNRERLEGTSTVYKVRTNPIGGRSLDLVVKWCRVGERVPFDTVTLHKFTDAEFNSPYEEFARVMELRASPASRRVRTHKPLAIYVPSKRLQLWQMGRSQSAIERKKAKHRDIELDICRQYILIYEWVKGLAISEALEQTEIPMNRRPDVMEELSRRSVDDLARNGFRVLDMKPAHLIVRPTANGDLLRGRDRQPAYALVDFELLDRTPEHEHEIARARRTSYLQKQRDRFDQTVPFPPHLQPANMLGVDYVFGHTESTQGALWVVGRDSGLFDYFQPERWRRTPRTRLSDSNEVYYTKTKDEINLVWKVSRVGEIPDSSAESPNAEAVARHGFNSPFEEFAFAFELNRLGLPTIYARAIYRSGLTSDRPDYVQDASRFESHARFQTPDGEPVLRADHIYMTVWGYWNGLDEMLAIRDQEYCRGINLRQAGLAGYVSRADADRLLDWMRGRLRDAGFEDLRLSGDHLLLSLSPAGILLRDTDGQPEVRLCNFETLRRI
ncbi:MAG: hypothetical protein U1E27_07750 [Kiritimatiellia bacterium]|nr:hypothetical protein [Kiritimatiellia bacterium]